MQLIEPRKHRLYVVQSIRPLRIAGDLHPLPVGQIGVKLLAQLDKFLLQLDNFTGQINAVHRIELLQLLNLRFQQVQSAFVAHATSAKKPRREESSSRTSARWTTRSMAPCSKANTSVW